MAYTFRLIKGSALSWAELDENFNTMDQQYNSASNSASLAVASANFKGNWSSLTGALNIPATVYHSGEYWNLLANVADVTAHTPGVSANWALLGFVKRSGDTMTGPLAQAAGSAALPSYTFSGSTGTGVWRPAANTWAVSTAGVERLRIDASGNVGVGATPSANVKLDVNGTIKIGTGTATEAGVIFSNVNWGMLFRAFQTAPALGDFAFYNSAGVERARIDSVGNLLVTGSGGLGYGVGSGGTVTQATSKSTAVTLNKPSGRITTNNSLLAANSTVSFQLTSSVVAAADTLLLGVTSSVNPDAYLIRARCFAGGAVISIVNQTGTGLSDVIDIQFQVIKGAIS